MKSYEHGKKKDKRKEFYSLIPANAERILDIGCGDAGWIEKYSNGNSEIIGIEKSKDLCRQAQKRLKQVYCVDIENFILPYPEGYFDCIIYGDILEHLVDPCSLLKNHIKYLSINGFIIASIPNVRYYKVILRLLIGGSWDYMEQSGLLDKTHLRFFTLLNIKELFADAGYEILETRQNIIAASGFKLINFLSFNALKEFLVYQYYIKAKKVKDGDLAPRLKRKVYRF